MARNQEEQQLGIRGWNCVLTIRLFLQFVEKGFVRLRGEVVAMPSSMSSDNPDGLPTEVVRIVVEDSGPGIPPEKRKQLFSKFQESLDSLHQGTGIGLAVCRHLIDLMGGDIVLDEDYDSGVAPECPGARFYINLNAPPISLDDLPDPTKTADPESAVVPSIDSATTLSIQSAGKGGENSGEKAFNESSASTLPNGLRILFVDDDYLLRRLFRRSLQKINPTWQVDEAANGETALSMTTETGYDLIFVDQYMSSVSKQLLGTETVRAMRASHRPDYPLPCICGLSANDMEAQFLRCGANNFMMKPFPCGREPLTAELERIWRSRQGNAGV